MSTRIIGRFIALASVGVIALTGMPATSAAADTTPPVLTSVSISPASAEPGDTVTVSLVATDDVGIVRSTVALVEETSRRAESASDSSTPLDVDHLVRHTWANGVHRIFGVVLYDAAGNRATYNLSGRYSSSPPATTTTHTVALAGPSVVVSGAADLTPPTLTSVGVPSTTGRVGAPSTYTVAVSPAEPVSITTTWRNDVTRETVMSEPGALTSGSGAVNVSWPDPGRWLAESLAIRDSRGNVATYFWYGGMQPRGGVDVVPHTVDFSGLAVEVAPGNQHVQVVPRPAGLTLVRTGSTQDAQLYSGYRVTVQPAGIVRDFSAADVGVGPIDLTGLPNGVTQTVTFTARSTWGDSPTATVSGRPVLSGNITGVADVTGDRKPDVLAQRQYLGDPAPAILSYPGTGTGALRPATTFSAAGGMFGCAQLGPFDINPFGRGEALCQNDDLLAMMSGLESQVIGSRGWRSMSWVDGGFSLNADAYPDIVAMNPQGELLMYPMTSTGRALAPKRIGTGWGSMISVISAGDLTGDRRNDIAAVDASGRLWLYPGNGAGGVTARRQIGSGWQNMAALLPLRDLSGDGKADLGGITPSGELRLYRGTGTGGVRPGIVIGTGWQRFL